MRNKKVTRVIFKKVWVEYFEAIREGRKKFELRLADFEIEEGDVLVLQEWDYRQGIYTGHRLAFRVGYVLKVEDPLFWSKEEIEKYGLQIISLGQPLVSWRK